MTLLHVKHADEETAALSVAANRASKCQLLRAEAAKAETIADRYAESLSHDVREWIGSTVASTNASEQTCERLHEIVAIARGES